MFKYIFDESNNIPQNLNISQIFFKNLKLKLILHVCNRMSKALLVSLKLFTDH